MSCDADCLRVRAPECLAPEIFHFDPTSQLSSMLIYDGQAVIVKRIVSICAILPLVTATPFLLKRCSIPDY